MGLEDYQKKLPDSTGTGNPSNNFNRPPISVRKGDTGMQGWRGSTSYGNILNGTAGVDWNTQYTNWSIDSATSKADKIAKAASIFGMVTAGATTALALGSGIAAIVQNNKEAKKAAAASGDVTSQADLAVSNAKSLSKSTDIDALRTASDNLDTQINSLEQRQNEIDIPAAEQKVNTLEANKKAYSSQQKKVESAEKKFADAVNDYTDLKNKLDKMKPEDEGYAALKAQVDKAEKTMQELKRSLDKEKETLGGMENPSDQDIENAKADLRQQKSDKSKIPGQLKKLQEQKRLIDNRIEALEKADEGSSEDNESSPTPTAPATTPVSGSGNVFSGIRRVQ